MKLFRQGENRRWPDVFERMGQALQHVPRPKSPPPEPFFRVATETSHRRGVELFAKGKLPEAVAAFEQALRFGSRQIATYFHLGTASAKQRQFPRAVSVFRRAAGLDPKSAAAHGNLGLAYLEQGNPEEAVAAFRKALEIDANSPDTLNHLGVALSRLGRYEE